MKIQGEYTFNGTQQAVWHLLLDPQVLRKAVPGVQEWEEVGPNQYRATLKIGLAAVSGVYHGTVAAEDLQPIDHFTLAVQGSGPLGQIEGRGNVDLAGDGEQTLMRYAGDVQVGGTIAGVAQRMLPGVSKFFIDQGLKSLARTLAERQQVS